MDRKPTWIEMIKCRPPKYLGHISQEGWEQQDNIYRLCQLSELEQGQGK